VLSSQHDGDPRTESGSPGVGGFSHPSREEELEGERSGMRRTKVGAQATLGVRCEFLNGHWEQFQEYWIKTETERMYPHRLVFRNRAKISCRICP
jgi:hypothetical protein